MIKILLFTAGLIAACNAFYQIEAVESPVYYVDVEPYEGYDGDLYEMDMEGEFGDDRFKRSPGLTPQTKPQIEPEPQYQKPMTLPFLLTDDDDRQEPEPHIIPGEHTRPFPRPKPQIEPEPHYETPMTLPFLLTEDNDDDVQEPETFIPGEHTKPFPRPKPAPAIETKPAARPPVQPVVEPKPYPKPQTKPFPRPPGKPEPYPQPLPSQPQVEPQPNPPSQGHQTPVTLPAILPHHQTGGNSHRHRREARRYPQTKPLPRPGYYYNPDPGFSRPSYSRPLHGGYQRPQTLPFKLRGSGFGY